MPEARRQVTALFGGTFDPPHMGHLAMARAVHAERRPELLVVAVAGTPPHRDEPTLPARQRFALCELAFGELPHTEVSDIDLDRDPAWAIDTIATLEYRYDRPVELVVGADQLEHLPGWHEAVEIFRRCCIVALRRPGQLDEQRLLTARAALHERGADVVLLDATPPAVDATSIRARLQEGSPDALAGLVPAPVLEALSSESDA